MVIIAINELPPSCLRIGNAYCVCDYETSGLPLAQIQTMLLLVTATTCDAPLAMQHLSTTMS